MKKELVKKNYKNILKGLLGVLFILIALTIITSRTSILGGFRSLVVLTGSMEPKLPVGSVLYVQRQPAYHTGDVIAFESGNINITHRIIGTETKNGQFFYKTKGDANNASDIELVPLNKIFGKESFDVPYFGRLILFIKTIPGFLLLVVLPTLIYIGFEFKFIKQEIEKEVEKRLMGKLSNNE
jgi:signal peptidase I